MENLALKLLNEQQVMALSTLRPDGWPQTTYVGYVNQKFSIYFSVFRSSQKFSNISHNDRVSLAVRNDARDLREVAAVYAAAHVTEVTADNEREFAWWLFNQRHPALSGFQRFDFTDIALMRADCEYVTALDCRKGPGYTEEYAVDERGAASPAAPRHDEWGSVFILADALAATLPLADQPARAGNGRSAPIRCNARIPLLFEATK